MTGVQSAPLPEMNEVKLVPERTSFIHRGTVVVPVDGPLLSRRSPQSNPTAEFSLAIGRHNDRGVPRARVQRLPEHEPAEPKSIRRARQRREPRDEVPSPDQGW